MNDVPTPTIPGTTETIGGQSYNVRNPSVPELDRYFSRVRTGMVTAAISLVTDIVPEDSREVVVPVLNAQPGLAVSIATRKLAALGFTKDSD